MNVMHNHEVKWAEGVVFYIFGATGDLARRKLFPALYSLYQAGNLGQRFVVIGLARRIWSHDQFRQVVRESIQQFCPHPLVSDEQWQQFGKHFVYMPLDINHRDGFHQLLLQTEQLELEYHIPGNRLFYLALAPEWFGNVANQLQSAGLLTNKGWHRLVIEKPFGYNLSSAQQLNGEIRKVFKEEEIYRIDHYLGKEMVQNIEVLRFANAFFEPLWNNKHIANIQISLSETVGVEERGGYYDQAGALRDMAQNHMLQMLTMIAMEPPSRLHSEDIRDEKVKVLRCLRQYTTQAEVWCNIVRGQYIVGSLHGQERIGYRDEDKVNPASVTETYFAARVFVDNFRWAGVPFYIRTGKRLPVKTTEVVVEFKRMPTNVYFGQKHKLEPNLLVIRVNPIEGIYIRINGKNPGAEGGIQPLAMDFCQNCVVGMNTPEAYERLLFDALRGDSTYFTRWDEVATAWEFVDKISLFWGMSDENLFPYRVGSWGPEEANQLLKQDGFHWWPVNGQVESEVVWTK